MSNTSSKIIESHENSRFSLEEVPGDNVVVLQIGGKSIEVLKKGNRCHSVYLPYSTMKVVDDVPGFGFAQYHRGGRAEHG